jgi:hypothetical protein
MYAFFAIWQTLSPWKTATALGFESLANSGRSEYLVVYGGFQIGLAAFFSWAAQARATRRVGLIFALCLYVPIVPFRAVSVATNWPVSAVPLTIGSLELALLVAGLALFFRRPEDGYGGRGSE